MTDEKPPLVLRPTVPGDLESLFNFQTDEDAAYMAAFMNEHYKNKEAYLTKWNKLLTDDTVTIMTAIWDDTIVGSLSTWRREGDLQITYWFGKEYWSRGFATCALRQFLEIMTERPLFGSVAFDNIGSAKVLTKCGFKKIGEERGYAYARKHEITEIIYLLES